MADRHKVPPVSVRLPEDERLWVLEHAKETGTPVNRIIAEAVALYRRVLNLKGSRE